MAEEKNHTAKECVIFDVKYVCKDAIETIDHRGRICAHCYGCVGFYDNVLCQKLPSCRSDFRTDGRNLIFIAEKGATE